MKTTDTPQHPNGGIYNYFQGATINNLVINGNMNKNGTDNVNAHENTAQQDNIRPEQIAQAINLCKDMIWGNAAYSVAYCVCRDVYALGTNATAFERMLREQGFQLPEGTINASMSRNVYMRMNIDRWEDNGAMKRVLKLRDALREKMAELTVEEVESA